MYTPGFIAPVMGDTYLKQHDAPEDIEYYLCGPPMMSKTVLDLLHSLGVEDDMIMFWWYWRINRQDSFGCWIYGMPKDDRQ